MNNSYTQIVQHPEQPYSFNHILFSIESSGNQEIDDWKNFIKFGYIDGDRPAEKIGDTIYFKSTNCFLDTAGLGPRFVPMDYESFCEMLKVSTSGRTGVKYVKLSVMYNGDERVVLSISFLRHSIWKFNGLEDFVSTSGLWCQYQVNVASYPYIVEDSGCGYDN